MIRGFQEMRGWKEGRTTYMANGNPGCEVWFRRLVDISRLGKTCELNEEEHHLGIFKQEDDFHQLARRFGRYKRMRIASLSDIRETRAREKQADIYIGWKEAHDKVMKQREEIGYNSEEEEREYREREGKGKGGLHGSYQDYAEGQAKAKGG